MIFSPFSRIVVSIALLIFSGCSQRTTIQIIKPAEVDVGGINREANVSMRFRLIDVETARIIATPEASHSYSSRRNR